MSIAIVVILLCCEASAVPVRIVAFDIVNQHKRKGRLSGFPVQREWTSQKWLTDSNGEITLDLPVGENVSFSTPSFKGYHPMQTGIITVPPSGMNTTSTEVTLQLFGDIVYELMLLITPGEKDSKACQVITTIVDVNKTWEDLPQGCPGVVASITPHIDGRKYYFGQLPWNNRSDPFPNHLNKTSNDGGVLLENVPVAPPGAEYIITASKPGYTFNAVRVQCTKPGTFINTGPGQGPQARPSK